MKGTTTDGVTQARGLSRLATASWTHIAVTYDGSMLRLFVNGIQTAARAADGNILSSTGVLRIGGNALDGDYFEGFIDEVRIYSRALTRAEIQADMATPVQDQGQ